MSQNGKSTPANIIGRVENLPPSRWHVSVLLICGLGLLFDNLDNGIISTIMPALQKEWGLSPVELGLISSSTTFGMLTGAIGFGMLADRFGRRSMMQVNILLFALFTGFSALAQDYNQLMILRFIAGLGLGGLVPVDTSYLSEYTPSKWRGRFMAWNQAFQGQGMTAAYAIGFLVTVPFGWRWAFLVGVLPAILVFFIRRGLPESVRHLIRQGRLDEAEKTVSLIESKVLAGKRREVTPTPPQSMMAVAPQKMDLRLLFQPGVARATFVLMLVWFVSWMTMLNFWLPLLMTGELNFPLTKSLLFLTFAAGVSIVGSLFAGPISDLWGRKVSISVALALIALTQFSMFSWVRDEATFMVILIINQIGINLVYGSLHAYAPEQFPTAVRATGMGIASSVGRLGGIIGPAYVGWVYGSFGVQTLVNINVLLLAFTILVLIVVGRETKQQTLEQITSVGGSGPTAPATPGVVTG